MYQNQTIAAISTAMANGGIGIIRISGDNSIEIMSRVFRPAKKKDMREVSSYTAHYGYIYDGERKIDECICLVMRAPNTYTKEDVVEINCHGGVIVMTKVLETVLKHGARPAEPGEFTKRAFLNGRIDLSQAEAVMDIISSQNEFALQSSLKQLEGSLRDKIVEMRKTIIHHIAAIESALDDPEHMSIDGYGKQLLIDIKSLKQDVGQLIDSSDDGKILKEGIKTVIIGKPNAGKSSLLNVLVGEERAIVTDIAGTTRDTLEESISIQGIPLNIIDTAGIRDTEDMIEKIGVDKAKEKTHSADLILYVVDMSRELDRNDANIMKMIEDKKVIVLLNKSDLDKKVDVDLLNKKMQENKNWKYVEISAKTHDGISDFYYILKDMFFEGNLSFNNEIYITNMRHKHALMDAETSLAMVEQSILDDMPEDFFSIDLMNAYESLGFIIGESLGEDLVNEIFSEFCMGK
ncbi:MAG: tRNA uridine-5-carboxymethylaminomethyl(34) synthesis GTPase MnmE [Lachnospiraceae bacterium]|nr:tRNA uridine-5-carboxymethylaminomethyl(34) synthesis GTPase MnmE [Lachnospiraceae bacterium]